MLKLRLFGPGQACYEDRPLAGFPNQQCHRLLCYLLLNRGHPHGRERLAAVFWSEYSTATSRKYLRNALWRLRAALQAAGAPADEYLLIDDGAVCWNDAGPFWLDVQAFEAAIVGCQGLGGQQLAEEQAVRLRDAVALYAGDLLEGVYEDWCLYDREQFRLLYLSALGKLLVFCESHGLYERGLGYGKRLLAYEPTREKVHRQVMRLYWLVGERGEALAQYKCCAQILREELGSPPTARTRLLYEQMLHNQFDPASWLVSREDRSPVPAQPEPSLQALTQYAVQKLERLQVMAAESRAELAQVEHLIGRLLATVKSA